MNEVLESEFKSPPSSRTRSNSFSFADAWHKFFHRFIDAVYFQRITLIHPERLPRSGPVLYLGLHRNGAVDGFVYHQVLRRRVFMISTQLRKNWFARLFFSGIAVTRTKDEGDRHLNDAALRDCLDHLRAGGELVVLPEGTSSLRPRHLPFKSGAIWLLLDYLKAGGPPLQVVPLGIHYECPCAFRSKVEVVAGSPISTELPAAASQIDRVRLMKRRVQNSLEEVGINVVSDEYQEMIQALAYVATLATPRSYFKSLKAVEREVPERILSEWRSLEPELRKAKLWFHQGVPLFPMGPVPVYLLALLLIGPVALAAVALNLPPFLAGWLAGKKLPDDRNVISLWKILAGIPVFVLWAVAVLLAAIVSGKLLWLAAYTAITYAGLKLYYRFKKLAVAVHNGLRCPKLRARMLAFRETVIHSLPDEAA
jgi:1-acyl-sn-glycerol-3-phosphate acyltransferase